MTQQQNETWVISFYFLNDKNTLKAQINIAEAPSDVERKQRWSKRVRL